VTQEADLSTQPRSRRNLLTLVGAGAAAAVATLVSGQRARAGHGVVDAAEVLHLDQQNSANGTTALETDDSPSTLLLRNTGGGDALELESTGQVMVARLLGNSVNHTVQVEHEESVDGAASFAIGLGAGIEAESTGEGAGVSGTSASGPGVTGHSGSGPRGTFDTETGDFALYVAGTAAHVALGVDNGLAGEGAGGISANSRGGKPTIEGDAFPFDEDHRGIGVQGVSYTGSSYDDGQFGEGPGTGVQGLSGTGPGVHGQSQHQSGVQGESLGGFPGGVGVLGFSAGDVGVFGVSDPSADGDGVGGFSENSVGGRFGSANGIGVRAVSPGDDHPALQAASGTATDPHFEAEPDGGLALDVIGKARFSTAGAASFPQGQNSVFVSNTAVTELSHITVTPVGNPGNREMRWVARDPGNGFTVHLSSAPPSQRPETSFTYLIVEPGLV